MSIRAVLLWTLLAAILLGIYWWTTPKPASRTGGTQARLLAALSGPVDSIEIRWPGGEQAVLERGPATDLWLMRAGGVVFPATTERVTGLLGLLRELQSETSPNDRPMGRVILLTIRSRSSADQRLAIDPEPFAGRVRVATIDAAERVTAFAFAGADFAGLLADTSLDAWRVRELSPFPASQIRAIRQTSGDARVDLVKLGPRWVLNGPAIVSGEPAAVEGLAQWLANATVERFVDQTAASEASPLRTLDIVSREVPVTGGSRDAPPASGDKPALDLVGEIVQRVEVRPGPDAMRWSVRVLGIDSAGRVVWGPLSAIIDRAAVPDLASSFGDYASRRSLEIPVADVASVVLRGVGTDTRVKRVSRTPDGLFPPGYESIGRTLQTLSQVAASRVVIASTAESATETPDRAIELQLLGPAGVDFGTYRLSIGAAASGVSGAPSTPLLVVRVGVIVREYPMERPQELIVALRALLGGDNAVESAPDE